MIIAVDFDGTIVEHKYPEIGKEKPFATATLRQLMADGHSLILWTVREGKLLDEAIEWCEKRGVRFHAANADLDEDAYDVQDPKRLHRKINVDIVIDDLNVGGLPDWGTIYKLIKDNITYAQFMAAQGQESKPQKRSWWRK